MVFEEIYTAELLKKKPFLALILGVAYSVIGMGGAIFLFPEDPALIAVALTSMLMLPLLRKFVLVGGKEKPTFFGSFKENKETFKIYLYLFLGSFITFASFSMMLPSMAANFLFLNQMQTYFSSLSGNAFSTGLFFDLFNNNLKVLIFCFIVSLVLGGGSIFIIIWNASLWGTIFGMLAKSAAFTTGENKWVTFFLILIMILPHMLLEVSSYILAAIGGSELSADILKKKFLSKQFKENFARAAYLFLIAVLVLIIAMLVETYVLETFEMYRTIVQQALFGNI